MTIDDAARPTFSVITIFHNEQRFLADAVNSVAAQTGPSWELILVDDGSTDRSGDLARGLAAAFPAVIRTVTHPDGRNHGMSAARNLGLEQARGEFVTFLDADDVWLPAKLSTQLELLRRHPDIDVLVSPAEWWWSWNPDADRNDRLQSLGTVRPAGQPSAAVVDAPELARSFLADEWQSICDLVIRRTLISEVGPYEDSFHGMFEDQVFHTKVLAQHRALVTGDHWYRYRQHDHACTASAHHDGGHVAARRRFLDWAVDYLGQVATPPPGSEDSWSRYLGEVRAQRRRAHRAHVAQRLRRQLVPRPLARRLA